MIKIAIVGAGGRMGGALLRCAATLDDVEVIAALEQSGHAFVGRDAGDTAELGTLGLPITDDSSVLENADAIIDFSFHEAVPNTSKLAKQLGIPLVIGTTGLDAQETDIVYDAIDTIPIVWAPNMSLGVNMLFAMSRKAAEVFGKNYSVEIDETHHIHKIDSPSGTALRLGEKVAEGRDQDFKTAMKHVEEDGAVKPSGDEILIRSYRKGEAVGDHTVAFDHATERIELTHHARSRDAFAMGAMYAARWLIGQKPGMYDMQDVLSL